MSDPIDLEAYRNRRLPVGRFVEGEAVLVQLYRDGQRSDRVGLCLPIADVPGVAMTAHACRQLAASLLRVAHVLDVEAQEREAQEP